MHICAYIILCYNPFFILLMNGGLVAKCCQTLSGKIPKLGLWRSLYNIILKFAHYLASSELTNWQNISSQQRGEVNTSDQKPVIIKSNTFFIGFRWLRRVTILTVFSTKKKLLKLAWDEAATPLLLFVWFGFLMS